MREVALRRRGTAAVALVGAMLLASCTVGDKGGDGSAVVDYAAAQGISDTAVTLGVAGVDQAKLVSLGVKTDGPDSADLFDAWVDAQNREGGVGGRKIDLAFRPFLPIRSGDAQAACVELAKDKSAFAVIGIFTGDTPLCFTRQQGVPYIGMWGQSADREVQSAAAPFLAVEMSDDRQRRAGVEKMLKEGLLEGHKVALFWEPQDRKVTLDVVVPLLEKAGIDVVAEAPLSYSGIDQAAQDQALDTAVEKIRSSGADTVLNTSNFTGLMVAFQRKGWTPDQILVTTQQSLSPTVMEVNGIKPETMAKVTAVTPYKPSKAELVADPELRRCIEEYNESGAKPTLNAAKASAETLSGVAQSCAAFRLFVKVTAAAGNDITLESWAAAADALGKLTLPGIPLGSLKPGKRSVGDGIALYKFDPETGKMAATAPAVAVK